MKKCIFYIILLLYIVCSCTSDETVSPQQAKDYPSIWGEISPFDSIKVILKNATNLTYPDYKSKATFTEAKLLTLDNQILSILKERDQELWTTSFVPKSNMSYKLSLIWKGKKIETSAQIPSRFAATITKQERFAKDSMELSIKLVNTTEEEAYYLVGYSKNEGVAKTQLYINSRDLFFDNNKYNELKPPFKHLYLTTQQKIINFSVQIAYLKNLSDTQQLSIKKVDKAYYNELYSYELQQQDKENIIIKSQNQEFIGILGACYPIELPL